VRSSPSPATYLTTSVAWMQPMTPAVAPRTGEPSFGGTFGKRQASQGPRPGTQVVAWPWNPRIAPWKRGMPRSCATRFSTNRAG